MSDGEPPLNKHEAVIAGVAFVLFFVLWIFWLALGNV